MLNCCSGVNVHSGFLSDLHTVMDTKVNLETSLRGFKALDIQFYYIYFEGERDIYRTCFILFSSSSPWFVYFKKK